MTAIYPSCCSTKLIIWMESYASTGSRTYGRFARKRNLRRVTEPVVLTPMRHGRDRGRAVRCSNGILDSQRNTDWTAAAGGRFGGTSLSEFCGEPACSKAETRLAREAILIHG